MTDVRQSIRAWSEHVDRAVEERPACDAQVVLDLAEIVPYGGSVAIMCMRGRARDEEIDNVISAVIAACWTT